MTHDTPHDPRAERFSGLLRVLRVERIVLSVLAAAAILAPTGAITDVLGALALLGVIASAPTRVVWLAQRWLRKGDRLYGALALVLVCLPIAGLILSLVG